MVTKYPNAMYAYNIYQMSHSALAKVDQSGQYLAGFPNHYWYKFADGCCEFFMMDVRTEMSLLNLNIFDNEKFYKNIIDNCTMYMVRPDGNKFWLYNNWVLAEWHDCMHSNPFETWKLPNTNQAKEYFINLSKEDE